MTCYPKARELSEDEKRGLVILKKDLHEKNMRAVNAEVSPPTWYKVIIAKKTTDPDTLKRILDKGHNDMVSNSAAMNSYCPADSLLSVISRREHNLVTAHAVRNHNCPPLGLAEYLKIGLADDNSVNIVMNRNDCPSSDKIEWFDGIVESGRWGCGDPDILAKIQQQIDGMRP